MTPKIISFIMLTCCATLFRWCDDGPERTVQPVSLSKSTIDSLTLSVAGGSLYQRLYSTVPCVTEGWNVDLSLALKNRNSEGTLDGIRIRSIAVIVSDTVSFSMNISTSWVGTIDAGRTDTVCIQGFANRSCLDREHVGKRLMVVIGWTYPPGTQRFYTSDSLEVHGVTLPY
jgi:hypothetical protein